MIDDRINASGNERTGIAEDQLIRRFDYIDALMNFIVLMGNAIVQRLANYILPRPLKKSVHVFYLTQPAKAAARREILS